MINRFEDAICSCCARRAVGYGYAPRHDRKVLWVCDDDQCLQTARETYSMKQEQFTRLESLAAGQGGEAGGAYLDEIGQTDLAELTPDQYFEFCRRVVGGYRVALANDLREAPPF